MFYDDMLETAVDNEALSNTPYEHNGTTTALSRSYDCNYEKYRMPFNKTWKDGRFYKNIIIENYGSGQTGSRIRNAVTGQRYQYTVGSSNEDLFFKVSDASGRNRRTSSLTLFYDSPEQFENHHFTSVSQEIKSVWHEKNLVARRRIRVD